MNINSLWISGDLGVMQLLTIKSFLAHGHTMTIWSYVPLDVECEVRDAKEILPEDQIFYYKHFSEKFKFGGIAERLKSELLYELGGWHVDLDVTCLKHFDFDAEYVFRPHNKGAVGNIIKAPPKSDFANYYRECTAKIDEENKTWEKSFWGIIDGIKKYDLGKYIVDKDIFGKDDGNWWEPLLYNNGCKPNHDRYAIHWCGAIFGNYEEGSYYHSLLTEYSLV